MPGALEGGSGELQACQSDIHAREDYGGAGACPEKGNEAGEGSREQVLWGVAEGAGAVQPGEEEAEGGSYCSLQLPERRL